MAVNYNIPFQTQLDYMMYELQGPESRTMDAFKSAGAITPQDYAELFEQKYERAGGHGMDMRKQYALEVFKAAGTDAFGNLPQNAQTAFNYFKGKGFTDAQAAGIVGNLMTESYARIDPQAYNPAGGGQGAYGIAQFRGPRLRGLLGFASTRGDQSMDGTQPTTAQPTQKPSLIDQMKQSSGGLKGVLDFATQRNPETGLSKFEAFAAALDPLILPSMRAGGAIREQGQARVQSGRVNKTIEWLKKNGYPEIAAAVEANPQSAANVMSSILSEKMGGVKTKVVGDKLINERTGEVIYEGDPNAIKTLDDKQVGIVRNLSNDLLKGYKIYDEVANGYGLISSAIKNKSGVDDYVLTVAFAKILDPESVVRESEQAAVARSGGAIDAFVKDVQNFIAGTGSLPENVRSRIYSTAQQRAKFYFDKAKLEYDRAVKTAGFAGISQEIINEVIPKPTPMPTFSPIPTGPTVDGPEDTRTQSAKDAGVTIEQWNAMSAEDKALFP